MASSEGRALSNIADRAYVLAILAATMPPKVRKAHRNLLQEAFDTVAQIPAVLDRCDEYEALAGVAGDIDVAFSKRCLNQGMKELLDSSNEVNRGQVLRLIDAAYRVDPELAKTLASLCDNDPARQAMKKEIGQRMTLLELRRQVQDDRERVDWSRHGARKLARAAWMLLGEINAKRSQPVRLDRAREMVDEASKMPMSEAYPLLACAIESIVQRFGRVDEQRGLLRGVYEATVASAEMAGVLGAWSTGQKKRILESCTSSAVEGIVVGIGERERAEEFVKQWIGAEKPQELWIVDPYFGRQELCWIRQIWEVVGECSIRVITSRAHQEQNGGLGNMEELYGAYWRRSISSDEPGDIQVAVIGLANTGKFPIHDRVMLAEKSGLRLGTSLNGIGAGRVSEISVLTESQVSEWKVEVERYFYRRITRFRGEKLLFQSFSF